VRFRRTRATRTATTRLWARSAAVLAVCAAWPAHAGSSAFSALPGFKHGTAWNPDAGYGALLAQSGAISPLPLLLVMLLSFLCLRQYIH